VVEQTTYDGQILKAAFKSAESSLEKRIEEINSLNVFPVPDGDTGINMYLTLQSAISSIESLSTNSAAEISAKAAWGALLGARGNSGVIFSQILRGMAKGMELKERFSAIDFAQGLQQASARAYEAVAEPAEGTILTVVREASEAAIKKAEKGANLKQTLIAVTRQARNTVNMTPELLPTLKEAGVVDAGGKGLFYFFQGMKDCISDTVTRSEIPRNSCGKRQMDSKNLKYGYDLQFLVEGHNLRVEEMRRKVESWGESVLVVGDENLIRVHVHTHQPQVVMDYCATQGSLRDKICDNMDTQVDTFKKKNSASKCNSC
jgi:uncharacterized protein